MHEEAGAAPVAIPNYLVQSILVTLFCCVPLGIPAIVYSAQVNNKIVSGDLDGARESSRKARVWAYWAFGVGIVFGILYLFLAVAVEGVKDA